MYIPKPLRFFNCQRFGHTAKNCREQRRCARCGGDHEFGKCGGGVQPKCCNCGGAHNVAYVRCEMMKRENNFQKIKTERRITYAEAARVAKEQNSNMIVYEEMRAQEQQKCTNDMIYVEKRDLVTFIAGIINSTAEVK